VLISQEGLLLHVVSCDIHMKVLLRLYIKNVAENALPQIFQEERSTTGRNSSSINSKTPSVLDEMLNVVPAEVTKNQNIHHDAVEHTQMKVVAKEQVSDHNNSSDAFAFVTEMKIQMSQPQNVVSAPVENFSSNSNKQRPGGHGKGGGRGIGRGVRKSPQSKTTDVLDNSPNVRHALRSQAPPVHGASRNMNVVNTKSRGYAQAVKRGGGVGDSVVTKSSAVSQATSTNVSPSSSDSQKY